MKLFYCETFDQESREWFSSFEEAKNQAEKNIAESEDHVREIRVGVCQPDIAGKNLVLALLNCNGWCREEIQLGLWAKSQDEAGEDIFVWESSRIVNFSCAL